MFRSVSTRMQDVTDKKKEDQRGSVAASPSVNTAIQSEITPRSSSGAAPLGNRGRMHRRNSMVEDAVANYGDVSGEMVAHLKEQGWDRSPALVMMHSALEGAIFVGHTKTDMDSIGSAIAGADFFNGVAARAENDVNSEIEFCLNEFNLPLPPLFEEIAQPSDKICLVDLNQQSQMASGLKMKNLAGILDHHAQQSGTATTDQPIYVDIRPWGSCCSIIAHYYFENQRRMPQQVAAILLCGILSDTLSLRSPTTTEMDSFNVAALSKLAGVEDPHKLAKRMFAAKSKNFLTMSAYNVICGDRKHFTFTHDEWGNYNVAFGVVETTDLDGIMGRKEELLRELLYVRAEEKVEFYYLALVDIVNLHSVLLVCGEAEDLLAKHAFGGTTKDGLMDLGGRVSRKKDFLPPLSEALLGGVIELTPDQVRALNPGADLEEGEQGQETVPMVATGCGHQLKRRRSTAIEESFKGLEERLRESVSKDTAA